MSASVSDTRLQRRLDVRLDLLFPADISPDDVPPPLMTLRVARALGVDAVEARTLCVAVCFYYAAADLADDLVDAPPSELERCLGINDVCALLFLSQLVCLDLPGERGREVARRLMTEGLAMAAGQAADIASTDAIEGDDPLAIARGKTGGELAALLAAPALLAGRPDAPFCAFGRAMGEVLQIFTDYLDLFAKESSDDWAGGKDTFPIRHVLAHPVFGDPAAELAAGMRSAISRQQAARWLLIRADTAGAWRRIADAGLAEMDAASVAAGRPAILEALLGETREMTLAVDDALAALGENDEPPAVAHVGEERDACLGQAAAFLAADPQAAESVERHRWGLYGRPLVEAGLFGRLLISESLLAAGQMPGPCAELALGLSDPDGWRYYPACPEIPPDTDDTGLALQVLARLGRSDHPGISAGLRMLRRNQLPSGELPTWLRDGATVPDRPGPEYMGAACPGAMANAVLGWHRWAPDDPACRRAADHLATWLDAPAPPASVFYTPAIVDALGLLALLEIGRAAHGPVRSRLIGRLAARRRLSGRFGTLLDTAFSAIALCAAGALPAPRCVARALVDAQLADGGYPAEPFYLSIGTHYELATYASRMVTTALVHRALVALGPT